MGCSFKLSILWSNVRKTSHCRCPQCTWKKDSQRCVMAMKRSMADKRCCCSYCFGTWSVAASWPCWRTHAAARCVGDRDTMWLHRLMRPQTRPLLCFHWTQHISRLTPATARMSSSQHCLWQWWWNLMVAVWRRGNVAPQRALGSLCG